MYGYNEDDIIDDIIEQEIAGIESGRRRGGRRFGRALAAIGTLGMSEAALRRGARNGRHEERASMQRAAAPQNLTPNAAQAAMAAVQLQQQAQLGFRPSGGLAGYFGITEVSVPALGSTSSASTAQEPTQLHRLILDAIDPTASITPQVAEAYLRVSNIRLGSQSMFNNNVPMTLGALKSNATLSGVMSRVIMPGQQLSIDYLNRHPTLAILVGGAALGPNS